ncbi:replicative DNA helicase [Candidatus Levyibacteriota bacterium]|nr:replicative DNA helicase [Candidatus Levybacteria bacterium]GDX62086.1 replicative DNA helicase [Candidatus Levybacteria bacterium]
MANLRVPPHNEDAEQSVLGGILIDKDAMNLVSELISFTDFYNDTNGLIFNAMLSLYDNRKPVDMVTLSAELKKKKGYEKIDSEYISQLVNAVPTAANIEQYAILIKEASTKRSLITIGTQLVEMGFVEEEVKVLIDKAESSIFAISQGNTTRGFIQIKDALAESFDRIDELHKHGGGFRGIKTGFQDLDNLLSGLQSANLVILAARPGQGKTAFSLNIAQGIAVEQKIPVGIFSLEMSKEELVDRLLVGQADVDAWKLKTGRLSETDFSRLSDAMGVLAESPIFIDDTPGITISEMRSRARRLQLEHNIKCIIVDYLQLVDSGRRLDNRVQEVSIISQSMKNLARELRIPVLCLSQLSRAVENRQDKRPQLADLRESGAIEQDADVVMFLYKPDDEIAPVMQTKLVIAKHRNGPVGEVDLLFRGDRIRFYSLEKKREDEKK